MAVKFKGPTRHGVNTFVPDVSLAFDDTNAEAYFVAAGFADQTSDAPVMTYPEGTVEIDPDTVQAGTGKLVMEG